MGARGEGRHGEGRRRLVTRRQNGDGEKDLVPWPVARARLGQIEGHPRRVHDEQGIVLSHLSLRRRHSAHEMAPRARLSSCSWTLASRALSPSRWRRRGVTARIQRGARAKSRGGSTGRGWDAEGRDGSEENAGGGEHGRARGGEFRQADRQSRHQIVTSNTLPMTRTGCPSPFLASRDAPVGRRRRAPGATPLTHPLSFSHRQNAATHRAPASSERTLWR